MPLKNLHEADVHDAGMKRPEHRYRKIRGPDGRFRIEKRSWLPTEKWVDGAGNVRQLPLSNAASLRSRDSDIAERRRVKARGAGWFRYNECLFFSASGYENLPDAMKRQGAEHFGCDPEKARDKSMVSEKQACSCVEEVIRFRQDIQRDKVMASRELRRNQEVARREQERERNDKVTDLLTMMAERMVSEDGAAPRRRRRKAKAIEPEPAKAIEPETDDDQAGDDGEGGDDGSQDGIST